VQPFDDAPDATAGDVADPRSPAVSHVVPEYGAVCFAPAMMTVMFVVIRAVFSGDARGSAAVGLIGEASSASSAREPAAGVRGRASWS
jgi:hypothetical protein